MVSYLIKCLFDIVNLRFIITASSLLGDRMVNNPSALENKEYSSDHLGKHEFLASQAALEEFIAAWRLGTLPKRCWTHAAHVGVGAYFAFDYAHDETFAILREGIRHYNTCVGTANTEDSGYHETLTGFWAREVGKLVRGEGFTSKLEAARAAVARFGEDKYRFRLFYSFDVVGNRRARREWTEPDLNPDRDPTDTDSPTARVEADSV